MKTKEEFIAFFEAIPEEKWCVGKFINEKGQCCARGHLGDRSGSFVSDDVCVLSNLLDINPAIINDGEDLDYQQPTPKQRILAALRECTTKSPQSSVTNADECSQSDATTT